MGLTVFFVQAKFHDEGKNRKLTFLVLMYLLRGHENVQVLSIAAFLSRRNLN
jgi:hypothetical protein